MFQPKFLRLGWFSFQEPEITRHFVLLHAPWSVLAKHAEEMHFQVPFEENDVHIKPWMESLLEGERLKPLKRIIKRIKNPLVIPPDESTYKPKKKILRGKLQGR